MNPAFAEYVHPRHFPIFVEAARTYDCHILVRRTGSASIGWMGRDGYSGKRADMKAKTAKLDLGRYRLAGLVCSPLLQPLAFPADRLGDARSYWAKSEHLITLPPAGFPDDRQFPCNSPYILQTDRNHRHYGCVAWVECGLLVPRYVHGDYDLYAILPAAGKLEDQLPRVTVRRTGSTMNPAGLPLADKLRFETSDSVSPLSMEVASFLNVRIAGSMPSLPGALLVNHGEQVNLGAEGCTFEPVLAVMAHPRNGQIARILSDYNEHQAFYAGE
ncbi:MAG: hypothetical protein JNJ60_09415 [Rhodocyclaceae bacterium]|nr:hypothetical protein [Rhodocyclaceae bacterium]